jgi:polysaccharide deacetylase 2 family uncharacterized protein YibQ
VPHLLTYRALATFWLALLLTSGTTSAVLAWLGPLAAPETAAAEATAAPPAPAATPEPAPPPEPASPRHAATDHATPSPDPLLLEPSRHGPVPRLGPDGRSAIRSYARPFDREDRRPRVAILLGGLGLHGAQSEEAIRRLPPAITLAFSPYAARPEALLELARGRGMELLAALPLEPAGFGTRADPGDRALLTGLPLHENLDRLDWALSRIPGTVGAIGAEGAMRGERFAANPELLATLQQRLTERGLLYLDARPGAPHPARAFGRAVDLVLDDPAAREAVERRLGELEALARANGSALGYAGDPVPSVVAALTAWAAGLEARGLMLAPVSAVIRRPTER